MAAERSEQEINLIKNEDDQHSKDKATPFLPTTVSVKDMEDLL